MKFLKSVLLSTVLVSMSGVVAAQDRLPPIPAEKMTDAQKKAAASITSGPRGRLAGPFVPLMRSPELMDSFQKVGEYIRFKNSLGHKLTEFTILIISRRWTQETEWNSHSELAEKAGLSPAIISAVRDGRRPQGMAEDEEAVYDFAVELDQNRSVSDATYERALKKFGEQGVIDLTGTMGYYTALAMVLNMARTPLQPGVAPKLTAFPH